LFLGTPAALHATGQRLPMRAERIEDAVMPVVAIGVSLAIWELVG
jgi:hypothetical protein